MTQSQPAGDILELVAAYLSLGEKDRAILMSTLDKARTEKAIMVTTRFSPNHEFWKLLQAHDLVEFVPLSHELAKAATLGATITEKGLADLPGMIAMAERARDARVSQVTKH